MVTKVASEEVIVTRVEVKVAQELEAKELPAVTTKELISLPPRLDISEISAGMELNPAKNAVFRGGNSLKARPNDYKIDPKNGLLRGDYGVSLDANPVAVEKFGGAYQIKSIPEGLKIIQRGQKNITHFEIVPKEPMSLQRYQELLEQIEFFK